MLYVIIEMKIHVRYVNSFMITTICKKSIKNFI